MTNFEVKHENIRAGFISIRDKIYVSWIMQHQIWNYVNNNYKLKNLYQSDYKKWIYFYKKRWFSPKNKDISFLTLTS